MKISLVTLILNIGVLFHTHQLVASSERIELTCTYQTIETTEGGSPSNFNEPHETHSDLDLYLENKFYIARGSQANVYRKNNTAYKVPLIKRSSIMRPNFWSESEIEILETIRKYEDELNYIVKYKGEKQINGTNILKFKYAQGGDLFGKLEQLIGGFTLDETRRYGFHIAQGISELQRYNILNIDLKLENILLDKNNRALITDFGLAKIVGVSETVRGPLLGTLEYLAPESVASNSFNHAVSLWQLGHMLLEMYTGFPIFSQEYIETADQDWYQTAQFHFSLFRRGSSKFESYLPLWILENIHDYQTLFPNGLDPDFEDLLVGLLKYDPLERLTINEVLGHPFFYGVDD